MRVELRPRQQGKTSTLLQWMREAPDGEHRICVSHTSTEAMRLLRENPDLESWQFVSLDEIRQPGGWEGVLMGRGGYIVLGLDNLDLMLSQLLPYWPIHLITINQET